MRLKRSLISSCPGFRPSMAFLMTAVSLHASVELAMSPFLVSLQQLDMMKETQVRSAFQDVDLINVQTFSCTSALLKGAEKNHIFDDISHIKQHTY